MVFLASDLCLSLCLLKDWGTFVFKTCSNMKDCTLSNWYGRGRKLVNREMKIFPFFLGPITLHPSSMPYFLIYYFQFPVMQLRFLHTQKTMWTHVPQTPHGSTMKIFTEFITHACGTPPKLHPIDVFNYSTTSSTDMGAPDLGWDAVLSSRVEISFQVHNLFMGSPAFMSHCMCSLYYSLAF